MERKAKETMMEQSQYPEGWKDEIWAGIEAQLDEVGEVGARRLQEAERDKRTKRRMRRLRLGVSVAAAFVAVTVFMSLPSGTAFMKGLQSWFAPQKQIQIGIEGDEEEITGELHHNEASRYVIYFDKERYKLVQQDGKDVITTIEPLPEPYPQVSLTIEQREDEAPERLAERIAEELAAQFAEVRDIERVTWPVDGYRVHAIDGSDRLSEVTTVYVTSNKRQGSFILSSSYFLEAAEGHGARFTQTLEQFEIVEEEE